MEYEPVKVEPQVQSSRAEITQPVVSTRELPDWDDATLRAQLNQAVPGLSDAQLGRAVFALREESVDSMALAGLGSLERVGKAIEEMDRGVDMADVMVDIARERLRILASPSQGHRSVDALATAIAGPDGNLRSPEVTKAAEWVASRARLMRIQGPEAPRGPVRTR